jgi:hypothetical protein
MDQPFPLRAGVEAVWSVHGIVHALIANGVHVLGNMAESSSKYRPRLIESKALEEVADTRNPPGACHRIQALNMVLIIDLGCASGMLAAGRASSCGKNY